MGLSFEIFLARQGGRGKTGRRIFGREKSDGASASASDPASEKAPSKPDTKSDDAKSDDTRIADAPAADAKVKGSGEAKSSVLSAAVEAATNVVTLQSAKLTERLAAATPKSAALTTVEDEEKGLITYTAGKDLPVQQDAVKALASALNSDRDGANVILIGPPGTGRRSTALRLIEMRRGQSRASGGLDLRDSTRPTAAGSPPIPCRTARERCSYAR